MTQNHESKIHRLGGRAVSPAIDTMTNGAVQPEQFAPLSRPIVLKVLLLGPKSFF